METNEMMEKLTEIFCNVFNVNDLVLTPEMTADTVEQWTSLNQMVLLSEIEQAFNVKFKLKEMMTMKSVGDIVATLKTKLD